MEFKHTVMSRENEGTERDFEGVGRDMSIPLKVFLEMRTSTETYFRLTKYVIHVVNLTFCGGCY